MKLTPSSTLPPDSGVHRSAMFNWMDRQKIRQIFHSHHHALKCCRKKKPVPSSKPGDRVFYYHPRILKIPVIDVLAFLTTLVVNSGRVGENTG